MILPHLPKGTRVRQSEAALKSWLYLSKHNERLGTVDGWSNDGACTWLFWDGSTTRRCLHNSFLDVVKTPANEKGLGK